LPGHDDNVIFCSFLPDGQHVVSVGLEGLIIVYRITGMAAKTLQSIQAHAPGTVEAAALSANGRWLITEAGEVKVWDLEKGALVRKLEEADALAGVALSADGKFALTTKHLGGHADSINQYKITEFRLWNLETGKV